MLIDGEVTEGSRW